MKGDRLLHRLTRVQCPYGAPLSRYAPPRIWLITEISRFRDVDFLPLVLLRRLAYLSLATQQEIE